LQQTKQLNILTQEIWGRAQLEAANRHKSNWKENLGSFGHSLLHA